MLEQFSKLLKERYRIKQNTRLILAVSGGLDSVVMSDLVHRSGSDFAIAHVNFLLRGKDSDADENFVNELSKRLEVPFYSIRENAEKKAKEWNMSIQMAARKIRYDYFERLLYDFNYDFVLTAHHLDDSFETALLNFIKSGSYSAISGIPPVNNNIIRPLISFSRDDIKSYANTKKLCWREDKSNSSLKYQRNILRHKVIPSVKEINPSFLKTFSEASDQMYLLNFFLDMNLKEARGSWIEERLELLKVSIRHLKEKPSDLFIFWELLKQRGFNFSQFEQMVKSINAESGKKFLSEEFICVKDREYFVISFNKYDQKEIVIENFEESIKAGETSISISKIDSDISIEKCDRIALMDAELIHFPLKLRLWKKGDKFQPLGMKGEKKISDLLIDEKVPINLKRKQYVLLSGEEIIWVVGRRINNKYKITDKTKQAIRFELK